MLKDSIKRMYIKTARYLFAQKFMRVMDGPLKGWLWTTASSYEYILGNYEDEEVMATFCSWLKSTTVFYDLGANVGFYSLVANQYITEGKIYAFEPLPSNRLVFEEHIAINKKKSAHNNIELLPFAISEKEKEIRFSNNRKHGDGNTYIKGSSVFTGTYETIMVKCYSIDELVQQGYEKPGIIKIDVEGAEYDVLLGAINTLRQCKPNILLATHDCHLPGVKDKCVNFLKDLGYTLRHTGDHNKQIPGLDDYIAVYGS